jgi:signal peptidase I
MPFSPASLPASLIDAYRRLQQRRRLVRESRYYLKEVRRILRWQHNRERVPADVREQLQAAAEALRTALAARPRDEPRTREALEALEKLVDAHLAFGRKSTLREYTEAIGLAALVAVLLRFFVIQPFKIPSGSMIPTLEVGDHIFVNKFSYGLMVPFTTRPPKRFVNWGWPKRGEVVVFIHKKKPEQDFIKRVVAIGGDRIKVVNEEIHLQRGGKGLWQKVPRSLQSGDCSHMDKNERDNTWYRVDGCTRYTETLDGRKYTTVYVPTQFGQMRDYPPVADFRRTSVPVGFGLEPADEVVDPYLVPGDSVFVMGDNRRNSTDSRDLAEVGFIPESYIKGRALVVWWSWGPESFRWSRVGKLVR